MEVVYSTGKVEDVCTRMTAAQKYVGGDRNTALALLAKIQSLRAAATIKDIIALPSNHFHALQNKGSSKLKGCFAIDVKGRRNPWRIIIRPLDENGKPFDPCNIDEISGIVQIVKVEQVSRHYE